MPRKEFAGAAPATRLAGSLAVGTTSSFSVITGGGAGYPTGATAGFVVVVDRGTALEEKIFVATRAADVFSTLTRGYDGTTAQAHAAQAVVEHVLDAATIQEVNLHTNDVTRDDHTQYFNAARHAATPHTAAMIQDLGVTTADLADGAVTSAKIADGTIVLADLATSLQQLLMPTATIVATGRATVPNSDWLMCTGALVSTTTYAALFAAIGHAYNGGADPGGGNFKLPDLQFKIPMGKASSGTGSTLGGTGGSKDAVVVSHGHSHGHTGSSGTENSSLSHGHSSDDNSTGGHQHGIAGDTGNRYVITHAAGVDRMGSSPTGGTGTLVTYSSMDNAGTHDHNITVVANGPAAHTHNVTINSDNTSAGVSGTDGNLQPYQVVNYMIKV